MAAWVLGMALQAVLLLVLLMRSTSRTSFRAWLAYDLLFSITLLAINQAGGARTIYPSAWEVGQVLELVFFGAAVVEMLPPETHSGLMLSLTALLGLFIDPHHVMSASALLCFVAAGALALCGRDSILTVYAASQCVQHLAILAGSKRWHPGAYSEVATCICLSLWIYRCWHRNCAIRQPK